MPEKSSYPPDLDPAVLATLACPACRDALRQEAAHLGCVGCGRTYQIVEGIPALIAERSGTAIGPENGRTIMAAQTMARADAGATRE